ncbi:type 1 glutamine amidotransferase [Sediminibacterium sp. C3]|uniref:type 1 glutamine amidotransferase n=1 Tax=Sediminibacterium sp. C3 TaxID=1267211 RepID=UPI0003F815DB|nr:GMP synthase [Sediminibacterium sp. C3]
MESTENNTIKIAILDLYEGQANEGMRCIRTILSDWSTTHQQPIEVKEFDVRLNQEVPDLSYDIFISSGGPGSPLETEGSAWEEKYFGWVEALKDWNENSNFPKKHAFFICHSFQLFCRYFQLGNVCKRKSTSFGVFPVHQMEDGHAEKVFAGLNDPFYCVDSRDYQVIEPNHDKINRMGGSILAIEKNRPHVPLERAVMAIRFTDYLIGTQFHPEADAHGMAMYLQREDKKKVVIDTHGEEKWKSMVEQLLDPGKIMWTYQHILPNFLTEASRELILH